MRSGGHLLGPAYIVGQRRRPGPDHVNQAWFGVLVWSVLWFPAVISVGIYIKGVAGPVLVTRACIAGSVFATARTS